MVAPHYTPWKVETADGRTRIGLLVGTYLDESVYVDEKGDRFKILAGEVADAAPARGSIMPEGLLDRLTDQVLQESDKAKRDQLIKQAFEIANKDYAYIPLHQQALAWGISKKLKVVQRADNQVLPYWMVKQEE